MKMRDLDKNIRANQINSYIAKTNKDLKERSKKAFKKYFLFLGCFLAPMLTYITTSKLIFLIIASLASVGFLAYDTLNINKLENKHFLDKLKENSKILDDDDLYTKEAKKVLEEGIPEKSIEEIKYQKALERQKNKVVKLYSSYDEVINSFFINLENYQKIYNMPPLNIRDKEWNVFFNNINNFLKLHDKETKLEQILEIILMKTLSLAIANKEEEITINFFVKELDVLSSLDISSEEINNFQKELEKQLNNLNVISLKRFISK